MQESAPKNITFINPQIDTQSVDQSPQPSSSQSKTKWILLTSGCIVLLISIGTAIFFIQNTPSNTKATVQTTQAIPTIASEEKIASQSTQIANAAGGPTSAPKPEIFGTVLSLTSTKSILKNFVASDPYNKNITDISTPLLQGDENVAKAIVSPDMKHILVTIKKPQNTVRTDNYGVRYKLLSFATYQPTDIDITQIKNGLQEEEATIEGWSTNADILVGIASGSKAADNIGKSHLYTRTLFSYSISRKKVTPLVSFSKLDKASEPGVGSIPLFYDPEQQLLALTYGGNVRVMHTNNKTITDTPLLLMGNHYQYLQNGGIVSKNNLFITTDAPPRVESNGAVVYEKRKKLFIRSFYDPAKVIQEVILDEPDAMSYQGDVLWSPDGSLFAVMVRDPNKRWMQDQSTAKLFIYTKSGEKVLAIPLAYGNFILWGTFSSDNTQLLLVRPLISSSKWTAVNVQTGKILTDYTLGGAAIFWKN